MKHRNLLALWMIFSIVSCNHPDANQMKGGDKGRKKVFTIQEPSYIEDTPELYDQINRSAPSYQPQIEERNPEPTIEKTGNVIPMVKNSGVYYVETKVNGIPLKFIFDTGASNICISVAEAKVLYRQGTIDERDFLGTTSFQDATGAISEGMKINLKEVEIGDITLENIEALVVNNEQAPLLLGQSVLERFGSVTIDYKNQKITLE